MEKLKDKFVQVWLPWTSSESWKEFSKGKPVNGGLQVKYQNTLIHLDGFFSCLILP
jgi:hypothetical protein